jgi:signal transduction histidine kinase
MKTRPPELDIKAFLSEILSGLPDEDLEELAEAAILRSLPEGTVVCREGQAGKSLFIIVSGRVEILKHMRDSVDKLLHDAGPGEFFGEMAIVQEAARSATVRTTEPTTLLEIGQAPFLRVLGRSPTLAIRILVQITDRLREGDHRALVELRQANEELRRALRQLERLDRTKSDFIQVSAHELRTPVAALKGYAQIIEGHPAVVENDGLAALVEGVSTGTERLHRIFDSILDMSRVINGELEIHRSPVSMQVVFHGIQGNFDDALKARGLEVRLVGLDGLPFCPCDPNLLYKAFRHLVNNAIKYTPDGGTITITGRQVEVPELGPAVEIAVEDTGIGIAPADLELVFEKFYRTGEAALHSSGTTEFKGGGPGLGLAIAQGIVLIHGGRIWAESPGYDEERCPGSRFVVQLPLEVGENILPAGNEA